MKNAPFTPLLPADQVQAEVYEKYATAKEILLSRMLSAPYDFGQIADQVQTSMFQPVEDGLILKCIELYRTSGKYSTHALAACTQYNLYTLATIAQKHPSVDLEEAWGNFQVIHGRIIEIEISNRVSAFLQAGLTGEEIKIEGDKIRKDRGLVSASVVSDGRDEFEAELENSINGIKPEFMAHTSLKTVAAAIGGYDKGDYIIVPGRPGMGKSYFGINEALHNSLLNIPVSLFNYENEPRHVWKRMFRIITGFEVNIEMQYLTPEQKEHAFETWRMVKKLPIRLHTPRRSISEALRLIREDAYEGCKLVIGDYVQLLRDDSKAALDRQIIECSNALRNTGLQCRLPLIWMAQFNRECEKTALKRGGLSDLGGSGALEQDATGVMALFRPEYYDFTADSEGNVYPPDFADITLLKGRNHGKGICEVRFNHIRGFYNAGQFGEDIPERPAMFPAAPPPVSRMNDDDIPF